jgi:hypothetical protein
MFTRKRAVHFAVSSGLAATLLLGGSAGIALAQDSPSDSSSTSSTDPSGDASADSTDHSGESTDQSSETQEQEHPPATGTEDGSSTTGDEQTGTTNTGQVPFFNVSVRPATPSQQAEDRLAGLTFDAIQCLNELSGVEHLAELAGVATGPLFVIIDQGSRGFDITNDIELLAATGDPQYKQRLILDILNLRSCFDLLEDVFTGQQ